MKARRDPQPHDQTVGQGKPGEDRVTAPPPCRCCGSPYDAASVRPIGVFEGINGRSPLIIYPCGCGTTRAVSWDQACERLRRLAREAQSRRGSTQGAGRR